MKDQALLFPDLASRQVVADFTGGRLSSDGGTLLLRMIDRGLGVSRMLAGCFTDTRDQNYVDHAVEELVAQRLHALALGYEDLNDHNSLRLDPLLAVSVGKEDPLGLDRVRPQHQGVALAGASTLNRMELSNARSGGAHKLKHDPEAVRDCVLKLGVRCLDRSAKELVLDLDAMGHLVHGTQEGRHFITYYDGYVYLPLYILVGDVVLWADLRRADEGAATGALPAVQRVVAAIRRRIPGVRILLRGDGGFCRDELMAWCEAQSEVHFVLGLPQNPVLVRALDKGFVDAQMRWCLSGVATREYVKFQHETVTGTWTRPRTVIGKAELTPEGRNPRFIVTNLPADRFPEDAAPDRFAPANLYEEIYCARGNCENILKQQVLDLHADRMSSHYFAANQLRLWFATLAYLILQRMRAVGLVGTGLEKATAGTIRNRLLKIAAIVKVSVRRVYIQLCTACPAQAIYRLCHQRLFETDWSLCRT